MNGAWWKVAVAVLCVILLFPVLMFLLAYLEFTLTGTTVVEDFIRWIGLHETTREILHRILL